MSNEDLSLGEKLFHSATGAAVAVALFNPLTFRAVNFLTKLVNVEIADDKGCPKAAGLALHALVYILVILLIMAIQENLMEEEQSPQEDADEFIKE